MASDKPYTLDFTAGQAASEGFSLAKIQVAPLIDTVLFLIWFYLLVGQLVIYQKDASVQLPPMSSPLAAQEMPAEFLINLRQDGSISVAGQAVPLEQLRAMIGGELAKAQPDKAQLRVVVRADRRQQFATLEKVLGACRQAGMQQVVFRAKEAGEP